MYLFSQNFPRINFQPRHRLLLLHRDINFMMLFTIGNAKKPETAEKLPAFQEFPKICVKICTNFLFNEKIDYCKLWGRRKDEKSCNIYLIKH